MFPIAEMNFSSFQNSRHKPPGLQTTEQRDFKESYQGGGGGKNQTFYLICFFFAVVFLKKAAVGLVRSDKCLIINLNLNGW